MANNNNSQPSESSRKEERLFRRLVANLIWLIPAIIGGVTYAFMHFGHVTSNEIGQVGDFFGGWLTPALTFLVMLLLIVSIRFQIQELRLARQYIEQAVETQQKTSNAQTELFKQSKLSFDLEAGANALTQLVNEADKALNVKINQFVDIIHFDDNSPSETRLIKLIDNWKQEIDKDNSLSLKVRNHRDSKFISKYLHTTHHIIYVCQTLTKNKGWLHISPHMKSITEHVEVLVTLYQVNLLNSSDIWIIKQAINGLHAKIGEVKSQGVVLDDEIISKMLKQDIKDMLKNIPTPPKYKYQEELSNTLDVQVNDEVQNQEITEQVQTQENVSDVVQSDNDDNLSSLARINKISKVKDA